MGERTDIVPQHVIDEYPEFARIGEVMEEELERLFRERGTEDLTYEDLLEVKARAEARLIEESQGGRHGQ